MRPNSLIHGLTGYFVLTLASYAIAQPAPKVGSAPAEGFAAAQALTKTFPQIATPEAAKIFGFATAEEAKRATVQTPVRIATIGLDQLKAASPDAVMSSLVVPTNAMRSFVVVDNKVTASVITREINGAWQVSNFGRPLLSAALAEGLRARSAFQERPPANVFELDIHALNLFFIAHDEGGRLTLVPTADDARFGFKKGEALDSQVVMSKIVPYAKELKTGDHIVD
jgi:hypothetical protein